MHRSRENLKTIHFESEMLPEWAQLLDVASRLCGLPEESQDWFSRFTNSSGVEDARIIVAECEALQAVIRRDRETLTVELERERSDRRARQIVAAWEYSLDTMIQVARSNKTCSWRVEGIEESGESDFGDGDITLRRL